MFTISGDCSGVINNRTSGPNNKRKTQLVVNQSFPLIRRSFPAHGSSCSLVGFNVKPLGLVKASSLWANLWALLRLNIDQLSAIRAMATHSHAISSFCVLVESHLGLCGERDVSSTDAFLSQEQLSATLTYCQKQLKGASNQTYTLLQSHRLSMRQYGWGSFPSFPEISA